jgi:hypothetical protein
MDDFQDVVVEISEEDHVTFEGHATDVVTKFRPRAAKGAGERREPTALIV